jgi:RNA polymerase sigma-70 factor (sigma-E family)
VRGGAARDGVDESFAAFVTHQQGSLLRLAFLLAGDRSRAEDLVQRALRATYRRWDRGIRHGNPAFAVRRALVTAHTSRRRFWRERVARRRPDPTAPGSADRLDDTEQLRRALGLLPPRLRAAVVLRYFLDLSVLQAAQVMGCPESAVDSQVAQGLARLHRTLSPSLPALRSEGQFR